MPGDRIKGEASAVQSAEMFKAVIDGETYESVAGRFGVSRTAVERRIKSVAVRLSQVVGVDGLSEGGAAFVNRLRQHRGAILIALADYDPHAPAAPKQTRVVSRDEIAQAAIRIKGRSNRPWHDLALFYLLFATGARPLEIARLEVRDYLSPDGSVRCVSQMRPEVTIIGKSRPLHFASSRLDEVLASYLQERLEQRLGFALEGRYRGLDPFSRLFVSASGEGFKIEPYGHPGQRRFLCRPILETYRKLFRYAELQGITASSARRTLIARLYERGADEDQVGLLLGISERSAVRELLPKTRPSVAQLLEELV